MEGKQKGTLIVGTGLALLAFGEFIAWYSLVFPESILYSISILLKISGLISLFVPISRLPLRKMKFDDLNDDNFLMFVMKEYNNVHCLDTEEFYDDLKKMNNGNVLPFKSFEEAKEHLLKNYKDHKVFVIGV